MNDLVTYDETKLNRVHVGSANEPMYAFYYHIELEKIENTLFNWCQDEFEIFPYTIETGNIFQSINYMIDALRNHYENRNFWSKLMYKSKKARRKRKERKK